MDAPLALVYSMGISFILFFIWIVKSLFPQRNFPHEILQKMGIMDLSPLAAQYLTGFFWGFFEKGAFNNHVDKKGWVGGPEFAIFVHV